MAGDRGGVMKDKRESDKHSLLRILVLGATFFMVGLCPRAEMAIAVFAAGMAVYSLSWRHCGSHENNKKNTTGRD
jgi:hypothetical protein